MNNILNYVIKRLELLQESIKSGDIITNDNVEDIKERIIKKSKENNKVRVVKLEDAIEAIDCIINYQEYKLGDFDNATEFLEYNSFEIDFIK